MKTDSKREWLAYAEHVAGCGECRRCQDTLNEEEVRHLMCGEGQELLAVARMHTREELIAE